MTILTYLKIAFAVVILAVCGFYVWNYHHMKGVIEKQQTEIGNLQEGQRILTNKQEKVEKFMARINQAKRKVANVEDKVDTVPSVPDPAGDGLVLDLLKPYRMRDDKIQHPSPGRKGGVKPAPGRKGDPRLN